MTIKKICYNILLKAFHDNRINDFNEIKEHFEVYFIPSIEGEPPFDYIEKKWNKINFWTNQVFYVYNKKSKILKKDLIINLLK